jgi:hypothetical protein
MKYIINKSKCFEKRFKYDTLVSLKIHLFTI